VSDATSEEIANARRDWKAEHMGMYLGSRGAEGHIVDLRDIGGHRFTTTLLLKTVGRKTGKTRITPLIYGDTGGEVVIVASKGGADAHPAWYLNIKDQSELYFQVASQAFRGTWREPDGAERGALWAFMEQIFPPYKGYQASTERVIPLVMMSAIEPVGTFEE
jgi:deazaflavin-dependent oxidoreductase (nitroreductase family)